MVCAFPTSILADKRLWQFLSELTRGEPIPVEDRTEPPWFETDAVCEISMSTYFDYLELFRPKWQLGSVHVSGEASGQGRLFWREGDRFFGRELTAEQSQTLGELAETSNSEQATRVEIEPDEQEPFSE